MKSKGSDARKKKPGYLKRLSGHEGGAVWQPVPAMASFPDSLVMTDDLGFCYKCSIDVGAKLAWVLVVKRLWEASFDIRKGLGKTWTKYQVPNRHVWYGGNVFPALGIMSE